MLKNGSWDLTGRLKGLVPTIATPTPRSALFNFLQSVVPTWGDVRICVVGTQLMSFILKSWSYACCLGNVRTLVVYEYGDHAQSLSFVFYR
jgi:hypothetical protein